MKKIRRLFKKRDWTIEYSIGSRNHGYMTCKGNYFEFIWSVFKTMI